MKEIRRDGVIYLHHLSSSSSTTSSSNSKSASDYLPYHTLDIKDSSPFLQSESRERNENEFEEGNHTAFKGRRENRWGHSISIPIFPSGLFSASTTNRNRLSPILSILPSSKRKISILISLFILACLFLNTALHLSPRYDIIPANKYHSILNHSISNSFPQHMKKQLEFELNERLQVFPSRTQNSSKSNPSGGSLMPLTLFQTDKVASVIGDAERSWDQAGAERRFLDDKGSSDYIFKNFNGSEISKVYDFLPVPVLKSDFLRYSTLLADGGVYSDMDTRVLMPLSDWWKGAEIWRRKANPGDLNSTASEIQSWNEDEQVQNEPVRFLVGIENDSKLWHTARNILESLFLLPLNRHRPLQFVQWTLQSAPNHPILVDTLRRIVDTSHFAKALMIEQEKQAHYYEMLGDFGKAEKVRGEPMPWNGNRGREFERTGVEEFTGPAVFTDSVFSYLNAVAGLQISDLQGLKKPLQVKDVVILPSTGFNPFKSQLPDPMARVVHLFRGSWK